MENSENSGRNQHRHGESVFLGFCRVESNEKRVLQEPSESEFLADARQSKGRGNGDNARITNKQLSYIVTLGKGLKRNSKDLDAETVKVFGVKMAYLTTKQASSFIDQLKDMSA